MTTDDVGVLLDALALVAKSVRLSFLWRPTLRDADDDMVLETAVNGRAESIVTLNIRDFRDVGEKFGCLVLSPGRMLRHLESEA